MLKHAWIIILLAYSLIGLAFVPKIFAQAVNAITVSPSVIQLDLAYDKPQTTIFYTNRTKTSIELHLQAQDIRELEDGYKLSFLDQKDSNNYPYRLSSWLSFDKTSLIIDPGEKAAVTVYVNTNKLTPGGHYASIVASVINENSKNDVQINTDLSSLFFVRTNTGKELDQAKVTALYIPQDDTLHIALPQTIIFSFENTGDTVLTPYGLLTITDPFGHVITKGIVNADSLQTLPESIRRYEVSINKTTGFFLPGVYQAALHIHFGKQNIQQTVTIKFFSQGSIFVSWILLILILIGAGFILKKKFKR